MIKISLPVLLIGVAAPMASAQSVLAADTALSSASARLGFPNAFTAVATPDAYYLTPGQPIAHGSAQIRAAMSADTTTPHKLAFQPVSGGVSSDGSLGYTYGYFEASGEPPQRGHGKYLHVWRRSPAGWRIAASVLSVDPAGKSSAEHAPARPVVTPKHGGAHANAESAIQEARRADSAFCLQAAQTSIADAFFAFADVDAASLGVEVIQAGRAAIRAAYEHLPAGARLVWGPTGAGAAESGDLAFTVGEATLSYPDSAAGITRKSYSKYLTVWRRQPAGDWKYVVDGGNRRPGP